MSTINLNNPRLRKYIREVLEINRYTEPFATLIEEVFVREQYVLELNPAEFYEDLLNFKNSVQNIKFERCSPEYAGFFSPSKREIVLNYDYLQKSINNNPMDIYCKEFFETFAHECLHGMQQDYRLKQNRAEGYNRNIQNRSHAIYEICTQGIAAKMTHNRHRAELQHNLILSGDGYSDEIFAVPLIAATFGISERDVLKYGVRSREELINALDKNIGNQEKTTELVNKIEFQLEYLHSIRYPDKNQLDFINLSEQEKKRQSTEVMFNLIKICQESLATRIAHTPLDFDKNIAIQYKYDQKKIMDTLKQEIEKYSYNFEKDYNEFLIATEFSSNGTYITEAMNVFNQIAKNNKGLMNYAPSLVNAVRTGNFEYCQQMGVDLMANKTFSIVNSASNFHEEKAHEDYNDFNNWDNKKIFEIIYYGRQIEGNPVTNKNRLNAWQTVYTPLGYQKMDDLRITLMANKGKYGVESRQYLLDFLNTPEQEMGELYTKFTRTGNARSCFARSFRTDGDKEFLAKLIAEKYIDKSFSLNGTQKKLNTDTEKEVQRLFLPTIQKYGRKQLVQSIANLLVNDNYQSISNEECRTTLAIYGKKVIFDTISQPLLDEMLNKRRIIPEKKSALQRAIYATEKVHPGTSSIRIAELIRIYKQTGKINSCLFSRAERKEVERNFNSQRDMEDLIGIICDTYSRNNTKEINNEQPNGNNNMLNSIIQSSGPDYFRENMIRVILYNDYSGFTNEEHINYIGSIPHTRLIENIAPSYIQSAVLTQANIKSLNLDEKGVRPEDIKPILRKQRLSKIKMILNGLVKRKDSKKSRKQYE